MKQKLMHIGIEACTGKWLAKAMSQMTDYVEMRPYEDEFKMRRIFDSFQPDVVFMQIQSDNFPIGVAEYMSRRVPVLNWSGDVRDPIPKWYFDFDKHCITCFSNMRDVKEMNGEYLQIGIDPEIFNWRKIKKEYDVTFMANRSMCFPLSTERIQMVDYLTARYKDRFKLYGSWPGSQGSLMGNQEGENMVYNKTKIGVSMSHFNIERYFSDRLIRIMGSGCFALSHHYEGIELDFKVGKHLDTFHTFEELGEKIDYYLTHEDERERIAQNGWKHVHRTFTTKNMVNDILRIYDKYKSIG